MHEGPATDDPAQPRRRQICLVRTTQPSDPPLHYKAAVAAGSATPQQGHRLMRSSLTQPQSYGSIVGADTRRRSSSSSTWLAEWRSTRSSRCTASTRSLHIRGMIIFSCKYILNLM